MVHIKKKIDTISPKHGHLVKKEIRIISLDILQGWTLDLGNCLIFGKLVANWPVNKKVYNFSWDWIWRFPLPGKSIHYLSSGLANILLDFAKILHVTLRWHQRGCAASPPPPAWSAMLPQRGVFASSSAFPAYLPTVLGFEDTEAQRTLSLLLELSQKSVWVESCRQRDSGWWEQGTGRAVNVDGQGCVRTWGARVLWWEVFCCGLQSMNVYWASTMW